MLVSACASSESERLNAPSLAADGVQHAVAAQASISEINVINDELCPVNSRGSLLVFTTPASGPADRSMMTISGVDVRPGQVFETGDHVPIDGGFTCGGTHFADALHVHTDSITIID